MLLAIGNALLGMALGLLRERIRRDGVPGGAVHAPLRHAAAVPERPLHGAGADGRVAALGLGRDAAHLLLRRARAGDPERRHSAVASSWTSRSWSARRCSRSPSPRSPCAGEPARRSRSRARASSGRARPRRRGSRGSRRRSPGALRHVSTAKKPRTTAVITDRERGRSRCCSRCPRGGGSRRCRRARRSPARRRSRPRRSPRGRRGSRRRGRAGGDEEARPLAEAPASTKEGREQPFLRQHPRQVRRRVEGRVRRARRGEQRGDGHDREAGVAERRSRRLGDRGLAVADHLRDGERAEDADARSGRRRPR